jgi:hypothetical protein
MKLFLKLMFGAIFLWMLGMTVHIQMEKSLLTSPTEFSWVTSPWACATLFDAYFAFLTFFVWVCYKESSLAARIVWFVLIMALGNIAISSYMLLQLFKLKTDQPWHDIFQRKA